MDSIIFILLFYSTISNDDCNFNEKLIILFGKPILIFHTIFGIFERQCDDNSDGLYWKISEIQWNIEFEFDEINIISTFGIAQKKVRILNVMDVNGTFKRHGFAKRIVDFDLRPFAEFFWENLGHCFIGRGRRTRIEEKNITEENRGSIIIFRLPRVLI